MLQAPQHNLKHVKPISSVLGAILIAVITFRRRHASLSREEIYIFFHPPATMVPAGASVLFRGQVGYFSFGGGDEGRMVG